MVTDYDLCNPGDYDNRFTTIPREGYLFQHWFPKIQILINKYCKNCLVIELGCGTGIYSDQISNNTSHSLGIDISKIMLKHAKTKNTDLNIALGDSHNIPIKSEKIDTVICIGLLEYVNRPVVLQEISRILKKGGICIIQCPNKYSAARIPNKIYCRFMRKSYFCAEPSHNEMIKLFKENNFNIIESQIDDTLIWLPDSIDKLIGKSFYHRLGFILKFFKTNAFSNIMLFVVNKK